MRPPSLRTWLVSAYLKKLRLPRELLPASARRYPDRLALLTPTASLTYRQLRDRVLRLADSLVAAGVVPGVRIGYLVRDEQRQIEIILAAHEVGCIVVGFTPAHLLDSISAALATTTPALFFYDPDVVPGLAAVLSERDVRVVEGHEGHERLVAAGQPRRCRTKIKPDTVARLGFTSGTSGEPKALPATHEVWITSLRLTVSNVRVNLGRHEIVMSGIPMSGAGSGVLLPTLVSGGTLILPASYDTPSLLREVQRHRVTRIFVTPSTLIDMVDVPSSELPDVGSLTNIIYGTGPTAAVKVEEAVRRFGAILQQGYGMAEVLPPVSLLQMSDHGSDHDPAPRQVLRSCGNVVPEVRVRIVSETGEVLPAGVVGQVEVKSPTAFTGYWNRPDLDASAFRNGYLRTRDYGSIDTDGRLVIMDRDVDVIDRCGQRVFPRRVEEVVHEHPAVKEACLVQDAGGRLTLVVSPRRQWRSVPQQTIVEAVGEHAQRTLPEGERPDRILLVADLPRSYLNKVLRRQIRNLVDGEWPPGDALVDAR